MDPTEKPKRPWWRRRRAWAAAALLALSYPLSFVPACWVLMRADPWRHPTEFLLIRETYRPLAAALKPCPEPVRDAVESLIGLGRPTDLGGIEVGSDAISVTYERRRLAEPGLTIRTHSYGVGGAVW